MPVKTFWYSTPSRRRVSSNTPAALAFRRCAFGCLAVEQVEELGSALESQLRRIFHRTQAWFALQQRLKQQQLGAPQEFREEILARPLTFRVDSGFPHRCEETQLAYDITPHRRQAYEPRKQLEAPYRLEPQQTDHSQQQQQQ